jgi:hypothetical protein
LMGDPAKTVLPLAGRLHDGSTMNRLVLMG